MSSDGSGSGSNRLLMVWQALAEMYGTLWTESHGPTPSATWRHGLADLADSQIEQGLRETLDSGDQYPPSLPVFRERCKGESMDVRALPDDALVGLAYQHGVSTTGKSRAALERDVAHALRSSECRDLVQQ